MQHRFIAATGLLLTPLLTLLLTMMQLTLPGAVVGQKAEPDRIDGRILDRRDKIVDTFIDADIGKITGVKRRNAFAEFRALNSDQALPAVVRGINKAAEIRNSCPIMVIARKMQDLVQQSTDTVVLTTALKNLNDPGEKTHYGSYLISLKADVENRLQQLEGRMGALRLKGGGTAGQLRRSLKPLSQWSVQDLTDATKVERGANLVRVLEEMKNRKGSAFTGAMLLAVETVPASEKDLVRGLLVQRLTRLSDKQLTAYLQPPAVSSPGAAELRSAAIRAIDYKESKLYKPLIQRLLDPDATVRTHAYKVLVKMTGEDFGPGAGAPLSQAFVAQKKWTQWEAAQSR